MCVFLYVYVMSQGRKVQVDLYYMVCVSVCVCVHMGLMLGGFLSYCQPSLYNFSYMYWHGMHECGG